MQRLLCSALMIVIALSAVADNGRLDSLYHCLDAAIARSSHFVKQREARIDSLRRMVAEAQTDGQRYGLEKQLFGEYKSYRNDSAMTCISRCIALAERIGDRDEIVTCQARQAFQCSTTGLYVESINILSSIDTVGVGAQAMGEYYLAWGHVLGELAYYGPLEWLTAKYEEEQARYASLALGCLDKERDEYLQHQEKFHYAAGDTKKALEINDRRLERVKEDSHEYAIVAFYRYMDYKQMGRMDDAKYWLARAALSDVRNAVMDQAAVWELANLLNQEGQLARSYSYINFAWESAVNFGTRMRNWQISPILQTIDKNYQEDTERTNMILMILMGTVCVMAVVMLVLLIYVGRQRDRLAAAHSELSGKSVQLSLLNDDLRRANASLDETNRQLQNTVGQLHEQTRVKEEYIGRFMRQCSLYIDRNDAFRKRVNKMLKGREYEELYKLTKSEELKTKELEEFYSGFDSAFLHLFPNFVDDFNRLLRPEERIVVSGKYKLNTALRIFALIRLGIEDSSTIAEFLHYSVNTIYNYRARVKNGASDNRESFEIRVKNIGMPE